MHALVGGNSTAPCLIDLASDRTPCPLAASHRPAPRITHRPDRGAQPCQHGSRRVCRHRPPPPPRAPASPLNDTACARKTHSDNFMPKQIHPIPIFRTRGESVSKTPSGRVPAQILHQQRSGLPRPHHHPKATAPRIPSSRAKRSTPPSRSSFATSPPRARPGGLDAARDKLAASEADSSTAKCWRQDSVCAQYGDDFQRIRCAQNEKSERKKASSKPPSRPKPDAVPGGSSQSRGLSSRYELAAQLPTSQHARRLRSGALFQPGSAIDQPPPQTGVIHSPHRKLAIPPPTRAARSA